MAQARAIQFTTRNSHCTTCHWQGVLTVTVHHDWFQFATTVVCSNLCASGTIHFYRRPTKLAQTLHCSCSLLSSSFAWSLAVVIIDWYHDDASGSTVTRTPSRTRIKEYFALPCQALSRCQPKGSDPEPKRREATARRLSIYGVHRIVAATSSLRPMGQGRVYLLCFAFIAFPSETHT